MRGRDLITPLLWVLAYGSIAWIGLTRAGADKWDYAIAGALALFAFQNLMKLLARLSEILWSSRVGAWLRKSANTISTIALIALGGVFLVGFGTFSWNAGWVGIAVPAAVLIPVITIFVVTGGWASVRDKFLSRKKEI